MTKKEINKNSNNANVNLSQLYKKNKKNLLRLSLAFWGFVLVSYPYRRFHDIETFRISIEDEYEKINNLDIIKKCEESNTKYINIFDEYDEFVNNTALFYKDTLNISNPIEALICFNSMIELGYLSNELKFDNINPRVEFAGNIGLSIIEGSGVCRNNAVLFNDILNNMGFNSYLLACNVADKDIESNKYNSVEYRSYRTPIDIDFSIDTKETCDHLLTVIEYNDNMYILDSTNNFIITREDDKYVINNIPNMDIIINYKFEPAFISSYLLGFINQEGLINLSLNLDNKTISIKDLDKDKIKECYRIYNEEPSDLYYNIYDDFYSDQFGTIKDINNILKLYKKEEN